MFSAIVPPAVKEWVRLLQVRRRYPHAGQIRTPDVSARATLGNGVFLGADVVVNEGVTLGDHSYANRGAILFSGAIGRFCSIGHYAMIGPENHALDHISTSPALYKGSLLDLPDSGWREFAAPPQIGSDVWIGTHAVILQGVNIGHGAVIAAGAVVAKDVEPYTIVGGVPAKPIRKRFDDDKVTWLLKSEWWDLSQEELRARHGKKFTAGSVWQH